jgi:hypothetical protein
MSALRDPTYWLLCLLAAVGFFGGSPWLIPAGGLGLSLIGRISDAEWNAKLRAAGDLPNRIGFWFGALAANCGFALAGFGAGYALRKILTLISGE